MRTIKQAADRVLCILPFEKPLYDESGVDAVFVGHPKADSLPEIGDTRASRDALGIGGGEVVAILPGSRAGEVARLGNILAEAARRLVEKRPGIRFVTPLATPALRPVVERQLQDAGVVEHFKLLDGESETAMAAADVVLLASGTAALESALLGKPTVATYRLAPLTHAIAIRMSLVKLTHYTLPNLLTDTPLVPELMQENADPVLIADAVAALLDDPDRRRFIGREFAKLRVELALNADQRAADAVIELARS
jgi:lipid-A-disaccharide synthase